MQLAALVRAVPPSTFGLTGTKVVAVVRECGNILGGSKEEEGRIRVAPLVKKLRKLADDKSVAGIVLRVDSGGNEFLLIGCSNVYAPVRHLLQCWRCSMRSSG
jgi:ClpP class serine protease